MRLCGESVRASILSTRAGVSRTPPVQSATTAGKELVSALEKSEFKVHRAVFGGEASREEVDRLASLGRDKSSDFVIALGGGKTIDTAKTVADGLALQVAILPTTASTDAPCSALSVLYRPSGEFHCYTFFDKNPHVVLVDTTVVSKAPPRFLAAGMGDAIATNVEARRCKFSTNFGGGLQTEVSSAICEKCEEILFKYGKQAYEANKAHAVTPALEAVVEANTLLSGLGFESGGLAAAHAVSGCWSVATRGLCGLHVVLTVRTRTDSQRYDRDRRAAQFASRREGYVVS